MPMDWEEWQKSRQKRNSGNGGEGGGGLPSFSNPLKNIKLPTGGRNLFIGLAVLAFLGWLASGFFTVEPFEVGLIKRFGAFNEKSGRVAEPGLNYHLPFPVESVVKVNINRTRQIAIGESREFAGQARQASFGDASRTVADASKDEAMMLTMDENIVGIKFVVLYQVSNAANFEFKVFDPEKTVVDAATSAMREVIGRNTIDDALTNKRQQIQDDTLQTLQAMLNKYNIGVTIQNVELQDVHVPAEVSDAFRDVTSAKEDSARSVNLATGYKNKQLPEAQGQAFAIEAAARAYESQRVNQAQGEAARFKAMLTEYEKAKSITSRRLMLEAMDQIMPGLSKYLISGQAGRSLLPHLGLGGPAAQAPAKSPAAQTGTDGQAGTEARQ